MRKPRRTQLVSLRECAATLRLSTRQVQNLVHRGLPVVRRPDQPPQYDMQRVWPWYADWKVSERERRQRSGSEREARTRLLEAQTQLRQLDIWERQGALVHVDVLTHRLTKKLEQLRGALLSVPGKYASAVAGARTLAEVRAVITAAMREAVTTLDPENT